MLVLLDDSYASASLLVVALGIYPLKDIYRTLGPHFGTYPAFFERQRMRRYGRALS
jgi:hypothetical protein